MALSFSEKKCTTFRRCHMCRTKARNKGYIAGEWLISTHVACGFDDDNDCDDVKFIIDQGLSDQIGQSILMTLNNRAILKARCWFYKVV